MNESASKPRSSFLIPSIGALAFVALLIMISYIGYRLDTIEERLEDRLAYQPPVGSSPGSDSLLPAGSSEERLVYVPVFSHIYSNGGTPLLLETTRCIRNVDPENPIVITSINYYDTKGNLVDEYISGHLELGPLESSEVLVKKRDVRGGSGASFLVGWKASAAVYPPVVPTVMAGSAGGHDISFHSNGALLSKRIEPR